MSSSDSSDSSFFSSFFSSAMRKISFPSIAQNLKAEIIYIKGMLVYHTPRLLAYLQVLLQLQEPHHQEQQQRLPQHHPLARRLT